LSYAKQLPIRIVLETETYNLLIDALKRNEREFKDPIAESAKALREKIAELVQNKIIEGISDLRDETSLKNGIKITFMFI
jgi:DNA gyrase/topoisomerase IV subunit A